MNKKVLRLFSLFLITSLFVGSALGVSTGTAFAQEPAAQILVIVVRRKTSG